MANSSFHILITDRNSNVLEFLRREFLSEGYRVQVARDGFDLCNSLRSNDRPNLIILDLDIPFLEGLATKELLQEQNLGLPVILHGLISGDADHPLAQRSKAWVKKSGDPQRLKSAVDKVLREEFPDKNPTLINSPQGNA